MALLKFVGGAGKTAEINKTTIAGTWAGGDQVTSTLQDEGGVNHQEVTTVGAGPSIEDVVDAVVAKLQGSTDAEFQKVTWSKEGTDKIVGTAKTAGVPFHLTTTENSASGTATDATTTANTGPNDYSTVANYENEDGTAAADIPQNNDELLIAEGSDDILYSLRQNDLNPSISLSALRRSPNYRGNIGDVAAGYSLDIDVNGSGDKVVRIDARDGGDTWWSGTTTTYLCQGSPPTATAIKVGGDVDQIRFLGPWCRGRAQITASMTLDKISVTGVRNLVVEVAGTLLSFDEIEADSGSILSDTNPTDFKINGTCQLVLRGTENWTGCEIRGNATCRYEGEGDSSGTCLVTGGLLDLRPRAEVSFGTIRNLGGVVTDEWSQNAVTYTTVEGPGGDTRLTDQAVDREA